MGQSFPKRGIYLAQWLVLTVAVTVLGLLAGYTLFEEHLRIREREEGWLLAMSRAMQIKVEQNLVAINKVLGMLADELKSGNSGVDLDARLATLAKALPGTRGLYIRDATGNLKNSTFPQPPDPEINDVPFDFIRVASQWPSAQTLFVSPPFRTSDDVVTIALSRMIASPDGEFRGIVVAHLDPEYFDPLLDAMRYAPHMIASLHHGDGVVFLIYPHDRDEWIGHSLDRPGSMFVRHRESGQPVTVFSGFVQALNEERLIVQREIRPTELHMDKPLGVAISRPIADIYALWHRDVAITATLLGVIVVALGGGLFFYQRHLRNFIELENRSNEALAASEQKLRTIIDAEPECVIVLDPAGTVSQINRAGLAMLGYQNESDAVGRSFRDFVSPIYATSFAALIEQVLGDGVGTLDYEAISKTGPRWVSSRAAPMRDAEGRPLGIVVATRDVSEQKKIQDELERLAQTDMLTGLANRRHFLQRAEMELARAIRYGGPLSLLMIDIDRFKNINDTYGHRVGDRVLQKAGHFFVETLRDVDCIGRIGGEEFAVLLPQTDERQALEVAERLRSTVSELDICIDEMTNRNDTLHFSVSIGVTTLRCETADIDALLGEADKAMYEAKRSGRNQTCVFSSQTVGQAIQS